MNKYENFLERRFFYIIILLVTFYMNLDSQVLQNKAGGICFRVDDNQKIENYSDFAKVFNKYNYKFCFAINFTSLRNNLNYIKLIQDLQKQGHELADHTPDHATNYFSNVIDTAYYSNRAGVDHINGKVICLKYDAIKLDTYKNEGLISVQGNRVVSAGLGEFSNIDNGNIFGIYIPELDKIFNVYSVKKKDANDVDTVEIRSFWNEPVVLPSLQYIKYEKVGIYDVRMNNEAVKLLAQQSKFLCSLYNIKAPNVWIQPGGMFPSLYKEDVFNNMKDLGYVASATYPDYSRKTFNEYDPEKSNCYGMQWGDFYDDIWDLKKNKEVIADKIAKHYTLIGHSHFSDLLGGWTGYLDRVDSILSWCKEKNILVKTYSEWARMLYVEPQNPYTNIFPKLDVDIDENGTPDGIYSKAGYTDGILDKTDGVKESSHYSYTINKNGNFCFVDDLAGLEKGENEFYFWAKGYPGSKIEVIITFPEIKQSCTYLFNTDNMDWTKLSLQNSVNGNVTLSIPDSVSFADVLIGAKGVLNHNIKISGMTLRKKATSNILPPVGLTGKYDSNVLLSWIDNSDNEEGFIVERKDDSLGTFKTIGITAADINQYTDSVRNYPGRKKYIYRVIAFLNNTFSDSSNDYFIDIENNEHTPVELTSFTYNINPDRKVILKWKTVTETNNKGFKIQRNLYGNWDEIGYVSGNGTTSVAHEYSFVDDFSDKSVVGIAMYRIVQINLDNSFGYSDELSVNLDFLPKVFFVYNTYPNPFNAATIIKYELPEDSNVSIDIYNALGEKIQSLVTNEPQSAGIYRKEWAAGSISSGTYFASVSAKSNIKGGVFSRKVRKMLLLK